MLVLNLAMTFPFSLGSAEDKKAPMSHMSRAEGAKSYDASRLRQQLKVCQTYGVGLRSTYKLPESTLLLHHRHTTPSNTTVKMSRGERGGTTLYVTGFGHGTRARDLAFEFERYVPLPRTTTPAHALHANTCTTLLSRRKRCMAMAYLWAHAVSWHRTEIDRYFRFGRLVRCDIPAPRTASSRL